MYPDPRIVGGLPRIEGGDFDTWCGAVKAAAEFGMPATQAYIVTKLAQDEVGMTKEAPLFLGWITGLKNLEETQDLMVKCYVAFAFRRSPPSTSEMKGFPSEIVHKIMLVRERVRTVFIDRQTLQSSLQAPSLCSNPSKCQASLVDAVIDNVIDTSSDSTRFISIFEPLDIEGICGSCRLPALLDTLKQRLRLEIGQYIEQLNGADKASTPNLV
ncbi:hypothetical protein RSOLAG1IB_12165 [Rhizoctonia solani AG-1 IB]|uniref:Uncharacterized protein n=1 Tax=Thanatephorus cucumeris (strain AG1-IB / isolate 7/3/14) TaxID=1108050 RepID=A0A0B7FL00_THACB|nr:hypothetical protein RSOLAG1IB_12165 [Rhizoctonia solani AG-1 IB]